MKERPILMSAPMVRAILAGTKTQTRRSVKPQPDWTEPATVWSHGDGHSGPGWYASNEDYPEEGALHYRCPYGQTGDRLWVRETWMDLQGTGVERVTGDRSRYAYAADTPPGSYGDEARKDFGLKWSPSMFMPRRASRITLEITGVSVERLQDISEADAAAEGAPPSHPSIDRISREFGYADFPRSWYAQLWEQINGPDSWDANPWVWVINFKRVAAGQEGGAA